MKLNRQQIKSLIKEISTQAPNNALLDKYAFADQRVGQVPVEPNNKQETEMFEDLAAHFYSQYYKLTKDTVVKIISFLENGSYKDVFHAPEQQEIYRGMCVNKSYLQNLLNIENIPNGIIEKKFIYNPAKYASCWTINYYVTQGFIDDNASIESPYELILFAKVNDNPNILITGPNGLYKVSRLNRRANEEEVIALAPVKVYKIEINHSFYTNL
jgi:hypothetical protein